MKIREFIWPRERIDHIQGHGVTPEEVEDVALETLLFNEQYLKDRTRSIMCSGKQQPDGIRFVS